MRDIIMVPGDEDDPNDERWEEDEDWAGKKVSDDWDYRDIEMILVVYTPSVCMDDRIDGCKELKSFARFNIQS